LAGEVTHVCTPGVGDGARAWLRGPAARAYWATSRPRSIVRVLPYFDRGLRRCDVSARRMLPTSEAVDLLRLVRTLANDELAPRSAEAEASETFPRDVFAMLGEVGVLGLPYPEELGGGGQPYEVYLQVLEEIGAVWSSVGVGVSVHALSCFGLDNFGTDEQKQALLPEMLGGGLLGAYCLSEAHAGSDP